jgi:tetratricopeptide (TPR) repeat protein
MKRRLLLVAAMICVSCALAGCNGPTKTGIKNRTAASNRLDAFHAQMAYDQARDAFKVGQFKEAQLGIVGAIQRYPEKPEYHVLSGQIYLEQHALEAAAAAFSTAIEHDPKFAEAHYMLGIVYQRWSNDLEAFNSYKTAFDLAPTNGHYLLAAAESLIATKNYAEARELVQPRLEAFEHNAALHHLLGQVAMLEGDVNAAVPWYTQARLLRPDDLVLQEELIRVLFDADRYEECLENLVTYRTSNAAADKKKDLRVLEARCLALLGRMNDSRNLYLKLSRDFPTDVDVWSELGALAWELEDYRRVALSSVRILALAPNRYEGHMFRGISEQNKGNQEAAIRSFQRAAELTDASALPHLLLGFALEDQGAPQDALAAYGAALQIDPNNADAQMLYGALSQDQQITAVPTDN